MVYTECVLRWQQFLVAPAIQQPNSAVSTPLRWVLKKTKKHVLCKANHSFKLVYDYSIVGLLKQRIALYSCHCEMLRVHLVIRHTQQNTNMTGRKGSALSNMFGWKGFAHSQKKQQYIIPQGFSCVILHLNHEWKHFMQSLKESLQKYNQLEMKEISNLSIWGF